MTAIYRRELNSYFKGLTGYVFGAFMLLFTGIYCAIINLKSGYAGFEYVLNNASFIYIIIIPILTMRSVAEERRQKTDQLLYALADKYGKDSFGEIPRTADSFSSAAGYNLLLPAGIKLLRDYKLRSRLRSYIILLLFGRVPACHRLVYLFPYRKSGGGGRSQLRCGAAKLLPFKPFLLCFLRCCSFLYRVGACNYSAWRTVETAD